MSTEQFLEKENERLRGRFNESYRVAERVRTVIYGTDWRDRYISPGVPREMAESTKALLDELRRALQDDQVVVVDSYIRAEKAEAEVAKWRARYGDPDQLDAPEAGT